MKWSKWPYWLRGGIISAVFIILGLSSVSLFFFPFLLVLGFGRMNEFFFAIIGGTTPPEYGYDPAVSARYDYDSHVALALSIMVYILIGAFVGYLFGKYRERFPGGYGPRLWR